MQRSTLRSPLYAVLSGMWLLACGEVPGADPLRSEEPLATETSALCSGASVSNLSLGGMSSYQGELAGGGNWAVNYPANAIRLDYYVNGVWRGSEERCNALGGTTSCTGSGSWSFSMSGMSCGWHSVEVRALPMVIDSAGNRSTCGVTPTTISTSVLEYCNPTASLSCLRGYSSVVSCSASGSNGTGDYTPYWFDSRSGSWNAGGWDSSYNQCAPPSYGQPSEWLTVAFKVVDSQATESNTQYAYFECALGNYPDF
ncbi:MAG TPA: hypothetical protein VFZ09_46165 [Archangium sp.]|uniref:hypothetical protein n=1 Tax=Archangium sp. TaxID=1872627 RepID=UPI002E34730D|nr:hypothetical protein [Archangium sp.]HEX5753663.1 hypothetical protein [Archangium sp.]